MKQNWTYKKLGEVTSFVKDGDWIESRYQSENGIRLIQTGNVGSGFFKAKEDKPHYISEETFKELGCTEIYSGDCLVSRLPEPIGRACIIPDVNYRMITAVDCTIIRFKDIMSPQLFVYYTKSKEYEREINNHTTGTTRKRISRKNLESVCVPVPPIETQSRIVSELDLLQSIIDKQQAQLKELDKLAQAVFYDMFGDPVENEKKWPIASIKDVCDSIVRGPFGSALKKEFFVEPNDSTYKVYEQKHAIQKDATIGSYYIDDKRFQSLKRFELQAGDIIMSCSGTIGELFEIPLGAEKGIMNQALLKFTLNKRIDKRYFLFAMDFIKESFETKGTGLQNIGSVNTIKSTKVSLPPLPLQQEFAEKIELIERQKLAISQSLAETRKLFDYTMDKYFG